MISKVIHTVLDILFPTACVACGCEGAMICDSCLTAIAYRGRECFFCGMNAKVGNICLSCKPKYPIERIVWPWRYNHEKTKTIIAAFKYRKRRILAPILACSLGTAIRNLDLPRDSVIIPIPLHKDKERERGFNQAALLAGHLGHAINKKVLGRVKATPPQARTHSRRERFGQMKNAFRVVNPSAVTGKNILLVDDVATTGATLVEAARVLKKAGAAKIYAAVLAHA